MSLTHTEDVIVSSVSGPSEARERLKPQYINVRQTSGTLCEPLAPEDMVVQSMPDASPAKWHLAHTTWFFEVTVLREARPGSPWFNEAFNYMFNSYYNTVGEQFPRPRRGLITRPTVEEVWNYRADVDRRMLEFFDTADDAELERWAPVIEVGLHHEQQHQELLVTDIKHALAQNPLFPVYRDRAVEPSIDVPALEWHRFERGLYPIGHGGGGFSYDNEGPRHDALVHGFDLASRLVTSGEYAEFIADGGYRRPELWLSEGWGVVQTEGLQAPLYWLERDGQWLQFTLSGLRPVLSSEPVCHVSYFEADAYARWAGARLPSEFEWEVAAVGLPIEGHFVESGELHPRAATASAGLQQMFGDTWEWTSSSYAPYPRYRPPEGALGE